MGDVLASIFMNFDDNFLAASRAISLGFLAGITRRRK